MQTDFVCHLVNASYIYALFVGLTWHDCELSAVRYYRKHAEGHALTWTLFWTRLKLSIEDTGKLSTK
jgi:hypothetical protein